MLAFLQENKHVENVDFMYGYCSYITRKIKKFDGNIQRIKSSANMPFPLMLHSNALANRVEV